MVASPVSSFSVRHLLSSSCWLTCRLCSSVAKEKNPGYTLWVPRADVTKDLRALNRPGKPLSLPSYSPCCSYWEK